MSFEAGKALEAGGADAEHDPDTISECVVRARVTHRDKALVKFIRYGIDETCDHDERYDLPHRDLAASERERPKEEEAENTELDDVKSLVDMPPLDHVKRGQRIGHRRKRKNKSPVDHKRDPGEKDI